MYFQGKNGTCFKRPPPVRRLGDPTKVSYVLHKKGKAMVLVKSDKAPVVCNGTGEPSYRFC